MFFRKVLLLFISAFFILSQPLSAQESTIVKIPSKFQAEWNQLDSMRLYGMSVDGIALLNGIIEKSIKEKNGPELFRALSEYPDFTMNSMRDDDDRYALLEKVERLADKVEAPLSNIVHGFLAEQFGQKSYYWFYWGQDYSVKCIINGKEELFSSIDADGRKRIVKYHQQKSLENSAVLQKINLIDYANSLGQEAVYYQQFPTLYDFMVGQVIQELLTDQYTAEYQNTQVDSSWFDPASELTVRNEKNEIVGLYQQVELFHWKAQKMDAFTNWTLTRLEYVRSLYEGAGVKNTSQKYLRALTDLKAKLQNNPAVLGVIVDEANEILNQNAYDWKNNPGNKDKKVEVHALLENGIKQFPGSIYLKSAKGILASIEEKQIRFEFKGQNSLGEAALLTVSYQNIPGAYLHVYHIDKATAVKNGKNQLKGMTTTKVHEQLLTLDVNGKYNLHSKDFLIPAWSKTGDYLVLISSTKDSADIVLNMDSLTNNTNVAFAKITVHGIRVVTKLTNTILEILVLDTKTGNKVAGAEVFSTVKEKTRTLLGKTNKEGKLVVELTETMRWTVDYKKDSVTDYTYYYPSYSGSGSKASYKMITDRGIYRPGQAVHFKVFAVEGKSPDFTSLANHKAEITLAGQDGTDLGKVSGTTNEFGTFAGTFQLPTSGFMPGNLYLNVNGLSVGNILVEEYKRPTFEIESKFNKTTYKPGEKVTISGKVKAYSGYGLGNSKVHVKVFASAGYRYYYVVPESILDTVIVSNANGEFSLAFTANSRDSKFGSLFSYEISATSISGETQRADNSIFIGKSHSEWDVKFPATVLSSEKAFGHVALKDKEESKESKTVEVEILKKKPGKTGTSFAASEFKAFDDTKFKKAFPAGSYGVNAESLYTSVGAMTVQSGDSIDIQKMVKGEAGTYQVKMIYKTALETIEHAVTFDYINTVSKKGQHQSNLWVESLNKKAKPGDEVSFLIGSSYPKANVLVEIYRGEKMLRQEWKQIKGRTIVKYTIQKEDLGGIKIHILTEKESNLLIASAEVKVPFESKTLDVKLETKRDILRPGSEEKWILSVSSKDGSPVSAEMVAAMTDASLDMFTSNAWNLDLYQDNYSYSRWENENRTYVYFSTLGTWNPVSWSFGVGNGRMYDEGVGGRRNTFEWKTESTIIDGVVAVNANATRKGIDKNAELDENEAAGPPAEKAEKPEKLRTNFNETAFFYPQVVAGSDNKFNLEFTLPDALTRWKFQALVHDKLMRSGYMMNEFIAQKELMVEPNEPRFFRAGDQFVFTANVVNLTENPQEVTASLEWFNPFTNEVLPTVFGTMANQKVSVDAKGSQTVSWTLNVPKTGLELVAYRIKVASAQFADGEEKAIPVLSNRTQVIESVPVTVDGKGDFTFELSKLLKAGSTTQRNEKLVLEYNSNPLWTVVMAIPYLSADAYESAEQVFSKYFANKVAQKIIAENPAIETILTQLDASNPDKFMSALESNPELKAIILAETPWVLEAKSESEQKRRIAQLFDKNNMKQQEKVLENKLIQMRNGNGGWSWFAGGESNLYITQHILAGFGHLKALGIQSDVDLSSGLQFLEDQYEERYSKLKKQELLKPEGISSLDIQWLYLQALLDRKMSRAGDYYAKALSKEWTKFPLQVQAMAGTYFQHVNMPEVAGKIMKSIQNRSTVRKNLGTYWNENKNAYYWDKDPIETQAALIEFYHLMKADPAVISSMKLWLLNQKRGQYWQSTKTTALACYALLMNAEKLSLQSVSGTTVKVGSQPITTNTLASSLGYVKQTWNGTEIQPAMGKVSVSQTENVPAFGSLTLVYTDEMEKISKNTAGLVIEKQLYVVRDGKEILITPATELVLGDLVRVRLQVATDRDLEFVHMKDLRASGMEPVEAISAHKMTGNLYFYMVSKDASTEFFLDRLSKGKHNLTYDLRISGKGKQSTGYAIAECLYAPEFRANSASGTVEVK